MVHPSSFISGIFRKLNLARTYKIPTRPKKQKTYYLSSKLKCNQFWCLNTYAVIRWVQSKQIEPYSNKQVVRANVRNSHTYDRQIKKKTRSDNVARRTSHRNKLFFFFGSFLGARLTRVTSAIDFNTSHNGYSTEICHRRRRCRPININYKYIYIYIHRRRV